MTIFSLRLNNLGGHQKNTPTPVSNFPLQFFTAGIVVSGFGKSKDLKNMEFTGLYICIGEGKPSLCLTVVILTC